MFVLITSWMEKGNMREVYYRQIGIKKQTMLFSGKLMGHI